jgi:hypothetical protein
MAKPLDSRWTRTKRSPDEAKDFEVIVRNSTLLLTRLKEILEEHEREIGNSSLNIKDFEDPNWSHKQAFKNGELTVLKQLKDLIPF